MDFDYDGWHVSIQAKEASPQGSSIWTPGTLPKSPPLRTEFWAYFEGAGGWPLKAKDAEAAIAEAKSLINRRLVRKSQG